MGSNWKRLAEDPINDKESGSKRCSEQRQGNKFHTTF